jgi:proton-translocating NADH-quinone oxidoreductase chain N
MTLPPFLWFILLPLAASPVVYFAGRWRASLAHRVALVVVLAMWLPFVLMIGAPNDPLLVAGVLLQADALSLLIGGLVLALGTLIVLYSGPYIAGERSEAHYYALLLALIGVMIGLGCAADLFNLWLWFEAMAVCSFLLVAFYSDQRASIAAGVKYLVQSATGSALVLIGIVLVLAETGTLTLSEIREAGTASPGLLAAGALFVIGFGVKAALVPLHTWLPDAHSNAPSGISALLSGIVIEAGLVAMLRSLGALAALNTSWADILLGFGALNMLAGNLLALRQTQVKRLLAYSSLSQIGYMLLGLGIGLRAGEALGIQGGLFHLLNHGLMKGLAFLAAGALLYGLHLALGDHQPLTVDDLSGAARRYPLAALALSLAVLGLGGLPPLAGFMSKWQIFAAGFATHDPLIEGFVIYAALNSVLSLAYYAPLVNRLYRQQPSEAVSNGLPLPLAMRAPLAVLALSILAIGVWPNLLAWLTEPASRAVLTAFGG